MNDKLFIYYPLNQRLLADLIRDDLIESFPHAQVSSLHDTLVGPHPLPHFSIKCDNGEQIAQWLAPKLDRISVLFLNHYWLGRELHMDQSEL